MVNIIAIPAKDELISDHFGHSREFVIITTKERQIVSTERMLPPPHSRGVIPDWLHDLKVTHVFANGIGQKAIDALNEFQIEVIWGVPADKPEVLVKAFLDSQLVPGVNLCDH